MKRLHTLIILVLILNFVMPASVFAAESGVDDLRGRWDIEWAFNGEGASPPILLYINEMRASTTATNVYNAAGCMRSPDTKALMPLSLRAVFNPAMKTYEIILLGTIVPQEYEPFVIRLNGTMTINGEGVKDDTAQGTLVTDFAQGAWIGLHHDRRVTKCPSIKDYGLGFQGDLYTHRDTGYVTPKNWSLYEGYTVIVSSGMQVIAPDGSAFVVQEYTDIFSPDVDFVGRFRYLFQTDGLPIENGVYKFSLLDIFGDPIPGTESTDVWRGCVQGAPSNITASYTFEEHVTLAWDPVTVIPGQWNPGGTPQIGFYQIGVSPFNWPGAGDYGSAWIASPTHQIPWNQFEPGFAGTPDGFDFGTSLGQLSDGLYHVGLYAFSWPAPNSGGSGHECMMFDSSELLIMNKQGSNLSFEQLAVISGQVMSESGVSLGGVEVGACPFDEDNPTICYGNKSNANGYYSIFLPAGTYRVQVGGMENWVHEFYNDTPDWNLASAVSVTAGAQMSGINFTLTPAGTISGIVYDADGNALANIAVDTEYGGYGTCTDAEGRYTLFGVPYGTHRVVAGRQFCEPHDFEEVTSNMVTVNAVTPHINSINFYLPMAP